MQRRIKALCLSVLVLACTQGVFAQRFAMDSTYVKEFPATLTVRAFTGEKISTFTIADGKANEELKFYPNVGLNIGLGATIRGIGLNLSTRIPGHDDKVDKYGTTKKTDVQVHRYRRKLAMDGYLQRYRGFHLKDQSTVSFIDTPASYSYFRNLQTLTVGASVMYVFNATKFSLRAPVNQQAWQLHSGGSPMLGAAFFTHFISNKDSSVIPKYLKAQDFLENDTITRISNYGLTINGGYGYTYVLRRHWYAEATAEIGIGGGYTQTEELNGNKTHRVNLQLMGNARAGVGYNSDFWQVGVYGILHNGQYRMPYAESTVTNSVGIVRLAVARRFVVRKKWLIGT